MDEHSRAAGEFLAARLRAATGFELALVEDDPQPKSPGGIRFVTQAGDSLGGAEAYELDVRRDGVTIRASHPAGHFYGVQTLLQLMPPQVWGPGKSEVAVTAPCVSIRDQPRFSWRGFMLDVSRHFFTKQEVMRVLDWMAMHKLNRFHWHLTDDQGWRIEIRKYPRLTEIGAWRDEIGFGLDPKASSSYGPDGRYGGFYTQTDIREIVAYARARHIVIVPEIDLPAHASAALAAYPEFGCVEKDPKPPPEEALFPGVFCAENPGTFEFLENVFAEICELFPAECVHAGGDEVPKRNWRECARCRRLREQLGLKSERELQGYFMGKVASILRQRGRRMIGWSESKEGGLPEGAILMDWIGGGAEAANAGHDVVMSPNVHCYLDYYQSENRHAEPRATAAYLPLERAYEFEPIPAGLMARAEPHILGIQGNLWTEFVPNMQQLEYMAFPRLCALSEVAWTAKERRNWRSFSQRLGKHLRRLELMGVGYRKR